MFILLLILIFIRPLISSPTFPYLNLAYSILLLLFLCLWVFDKRFSIKKVSTVQYPVILFCIALAISIAFSSNEINSLKESYKYINGLFLFIVAVSFSAEQKKSVSEVIVLAALTVSLLAIYQYFLGFRHISDYIARQNISDVFTLDYIIPKRVFIPFVTPNLLAGFLAMVVPLTFSQKHKALFAVPIFLALILTQSLAAFLSLTCGIFIYFYLRGNLKKKHIALMISLLLLLSAIFMMRLLTQKQHFQPAFSAIMRLNYWKQAVDIIKASPLTGIGIGNFNLPASRYAHNSYLQIWAEMGLLGLISFLWLVVSGFKISLQNIKDSPYKIQIAGLIAANAVFLIHNLLDFSFFLPEVSFIWWVIFGLAVAAQ